MGSCSSTLSNMGLCTLFFLVVIVLMDVDQHVDQGRSPDQPSYTLYSSPHTRRRLSLTCALRALGSAPLAARLRPRPCSPTSTSPWLISSLSQDQDLALWRRANFGSSKLRIESDRMITVGFPRKSDAQSLELTRIGWNWGVVVGEMGCGACGSDCEAQA